MDKVELYRQVFTTFRELCATGQQPCSFQAYCMKHGVDRKKMPRLLRYEYQNVTTLPGYKRLQPDWIAHLCLQVYDEFKALCASGKQPGSFDSFSQSRGISRTQMGNFLNSNKLKLTGLPGYERNFGSNAIARLCQQAYDEFKALCASGKQPGSFMSYCQSRCISRQQMYRFLHRNKLKLAGLPGYERRHGSNGIAGLCQQAYDEFKALCATGKQPGAFTSYCKSRGISHKQMGNFLYRNKLKLTGLPGYERIFGHNRIASLCQQVYDEFKALCASGKRQGTFKSYYQSRGISRGQMRNFQSRNKIRVAGLPGYELYSGHRHPAAEEVPFESVIFEEAGFLPAAGGASITVKVDGRVAVSFPADTDVDVIARFIRKMGKEASHVGA